MLLFALVATALIWMHVTIVRMERRKVPELAEPAYLPELAVLGKPPAHVAPIAGGGRHAPAHARTPS
jgi:hypothetical protein